MVDSLEAQDLLDKYYTLEYMRISPSVHGKNTDVNRNDIIRTCLEYEQDKENSTGIFYLYARGYAVTKSEQFAAAFACVSSGTNLSVILNNKNAASKYSLTKHIPALIEAEQLLGQGKEVSVKYRNITTVKIQEFTNTSKEEAERIVKERNRKVMAEKLAPPTTQAPNDTEWWNFFVDIITKVVGIGGGLVGLFGGGGLIGYLKWQHKFCFKKITRKHDTIEKGNDEENVPLAIVNKKYGMLGEQPIVIVSSYEEEITKQEKQIPNQKKKITTQEEQTTDTELELSASLINTQVQEEEVETFNQEDKIIDTELELQAFLINAQVQEEGVEILNQEEQTTDAEIEELQAFLINTEVQEESELPSEEPVSTALLLTEEVIHLAGESVSNITSTAEILSTL